MRNCVLVVLFFARVALGDVLLKASGVSIGPVSALNCGVNMSCSRAGTTGTIDWVHGLTCAAGAVLTTASTSTMACTTTVATAGTATTANDLSCAGTCVGDSEIAALAGVKVSGSVALATLASTANDLVCVGTCVGDSEIAALAGVKVSGAVSLATLATTANTANDLSCAGTCVGDSEIAALAGAKISGSVALATLASNATNAATAADLACVGTCVSDGEISGVGGAKVSGSVANATTAAVANDLTCASTCVGDTEIAALSGAKVSGAVALATSASSAADLVCVGTCVSDGEIVGVAGGKVSGAVALATSASSAADLSCTGCVADVEITALTGSKVSGSVASAYAADASITAAQFATDPADCAANQYAKTISISGALTCEQVTIAAAATALTVDPGNCPTDGPTQVAGGIDQFGVAQCKSITMSSVTGLPTCSALQNYTCNGTSCDCTSKTQVGAVGNSGASGASAFVAKASGGAQGQRAGVAFYATFEGTGDSSPRRAADIIAGFNGSAWGAQFLAFMVGGATANDGENLSSLIEVMRLTSTGATIVQRPWTAVNAAGGAAPAFTAGWTNYSGYGRPCGFFTDSVGVVHLKGLVSRRSSSATTIFVLPVGYRPSATALIFRPFGYNTTTSASFGSLLNESIRIDAAGNVFVFGGPSTDSLDISLEGITFDTR